jgi:RNA polymerase sigma-70 factor (ECF subfamily)
LVEIPVIRSEFVCMASADHEEIQQLVEQAVEGDRAAYSKIVRMMMKPVVALAFRMTGDREAARDIAQDTFVSAWQNLSRFRGEAKFESWLYRIASNKTLNYLHSQKRFQPPDESSVPDRVSEIDSPDRTLEKEELQRNVLAFMESLPEQQRLVFNLRFYREMQFDEIAEVLGKAVGTVKTNYREAVRKLKELAVEKGWQ